MTTLKVKSAEWIDAQGICDEKKLVAAILSGNLEASSYLFSEYARSVFSSVCVKTGTRMRCSPHEICNAVYERISANNYRLLRNFNFLCSLRSWLWLIALHCVYAHFRAQKRRQLYEKSTENLSQYQELDLSEDKNETFAEENAVDFECINLALARMKNDYYRELLIMRAIDGLCCQQTAKLLKRKPESVKRAYSRAKNDLKKHFLFLRKKKRKPHL